jgi:hypothetical protein
LCSCRDMQSTPGPNIGPNKIGELGRIGKDTNEWDCAENLDKRAVTL